MEKSSDAFRTISEVADHLETPAHVLRFWESRFPQIKPVKRAGGRRYYRPVDVALLSGIKRLLHDEGLTIRGVQKILREQGVRHVAGLAEDTTPTPEASFVDHAEAPAPLAEVVSMAAWSAQAAAPAPAEPIPEPQELSATLAEAMADDAAVWPGEGPAPWGDDPAAEDDTDDDQTEEDDLVFDGVTAEQFAPEMVEAWRAAAAHLPDEPAPDVSRWAQTDLFAPPPLPDTADSPPEPAPPPAPAVAEAESVWLPAVLRRLPHGALANRLDALLPLQARLVALRDAMVQAARSPRN
ncbi:MerR family transcriptional regulator [Rhodobacter ferrooxidans]|uniref:Transcriptional regulator, MerR family n=1 Tax=Rhodobacter ferrooxidans TaxID=371731 RepID=C8RZM0_9RHOB|nr:MerR family transcriptional regulator [Rhodobacter sp. SW2]EEW25817.1 transcriptional regulator, MerR family [Rhodobacter sp. SW2]